MKANSRMQIGVYKLQGWFFKHALKYRFYYFKNSVSFSSPKFNRMCLNGWFYDTFGGGILNCRRQGRRPQGRKEFRIVTLVAAGWMFAWMLTSNLCSEVINIDSFLPWGLCFGWREKNSEFVFGEIWGWFQMSVTFQEVRVLKDWHLNYQ